MLTFSVMFRFLFGNDWPIVLNYCSWPCADHEPLGPLGPLGAIPDPTGGFPSHGGARLQQPRLKDLLRLKPEKRPSAAAIARHPWLVGVLRMDVQVQLHYITLHTIRYIHTCEWELGYGITYVPTYIALIIPLPRGHECRPFGSSHYSCRSPRKEHSSRSCDPVVVSKDNSTHYLQEAYIG